MYSIRESKSFRKSLRKLKKSGIKNSVLDDLKLVINKISKGEKLPKEYEDHELNGEYLGYRDCHIRGDLLLIYTIEKEKLVLVLINIGSHSELF